MALLAARLWFQIVCMHKTQTAQLALLELPVTEPSPRRRRDRMSPEMTVKHCQELLAALDRAQQNQAERLANLFEAALRSGAEAKRESAA